VAEIDGKRCQMPTQCNCRDVMATIVKQGHTPVVVAPDFVIMKYSYTH